MKKFYNLIENAKNRIENLRNECGTKPKLSLIDDIIEIKLGIFPHFITDSEIIAEKNNFSKLFEESKISIDKSKLLSVALIKIKKLFDSKFQNKDEQVNVVKGKTRSNLKKLIDNAESWIIKDKIEK